MTILNAIKEGQQQQDFRQAHDLLMQLIQPEQYVGNVYSIGYEFANVQIHDFHRRRVGGIPSLCFLVATRIQPQETLLDYQLEDSSIILLRVMDASPLPGHSEAERIRVELAQKVSGEVAVHWDDSGSMDATTHHLLSFAGVRCRVIGTFFVDRSERPNMPVLRFGSDLSNFYPNHDLTVYKPNAAALQAIVNYTDPERVEPGQSLAQVQIGEVRYASTNRGFQGVSNVDVHISPADLLGQKTALFGMTRTGKSNTTKIIVQSVFAMRFSEQQPRRIGQIVFDPNGEYANENEQDASKQKNPAAIKNVWQSHKAGNINDVITYGILPHPQDPRRKLMLLNFFADENLQLGKEIINEALSDDKTKFIQNFRHVVFDPPDPSDASATTRHNRRVLVYRSLLAKAGFVVPRTLQANTTRLFNANLLQAMANSQAGDTAAHKSAGKILENAKPSWDELAFALAALMDFMGDNKKAYGAFEEQYIKTSTTGETWADEDLKTLLTMYKYPNGVRQIGQVRNQHTSETTSDYADDIYEQLTQGKLVIVDQSSGDPTINQASAERIVWAIFRAQQARFRRGDPQLPEVLLYIEEAHNLLPAATDSDYQDVWVRTAKEGAKYHIGMVYATQEVSSIQRNILKNTANWFIGHLNNTDETKELRKYYDFEDFEASIRRAQDRGFLRVKTLSNLFVIPVQVRRFEV